MMRRYNIYKVIAKTLQERIHEHLAADMQTALVEMGRQMNTGRQLDASDGVDIPLTVGNGYGSAPGISQQPSDVIRRTVDDEITAAIPILPSGIVAGNRFEIEVVGMEGERAGLCVMEQSDADG